MEHVSTWGEITPESIGRAVTRLFEYVADWPSLPGIGQKIAYDEGGDLFALDPGTVNISMEHIQATDEHEEYITIYMEGWKRYDND